MSDELHEAVEITQKPHWPLNSKRTNDKCSNDASYVCDRRDEIHSTENETSSVGIFAERLWTSVRHVRSEWRQNICWNGQLKTKCSVINGWPFAASNKQRKTEKIVREMLGKNACNGMVRRGHKHFNFGCLKWVPEIILCIHGMRCCSWEKSFIIRMEQEQVDDEDEDKSVIIPKINRLHVSFIHFNSMPLPYCSVHAWIYNITFAICLMMRTAGSAHFECRFCSKFE